MATADLLLHPVRLRILKVLLDGRDRTTSDLRAELPDIAAATLYRHVALLAEAGVLTVVAQQRVRGAVERTYRLHRAAAEVDDDALAAMTPDDHRRAFTAFVAGLLTDFDHYLDRDDIDPRRDGISFRQVALWLTDAELNTLLTELRAVITARLPNRPAPGRTKRLLSTVLMPGSHPPGADTAEETGGAR